MVAHYESIFQCRGSCPALDAYVRRLSEIPVLVLDDHRLYFLRRDNCGTGEERSGKNRGQHVARRKTHDYASEFPFVD